jgi:hypothetical protein
MAAVTLTRDVCAGQRGARADLARQLVRLKGHCLDLTKPQRRSADD